MSYSLTIDHKHRIIRYQHSGQLQVEDIGRAWNELLQIKEFTHHHYHLFSDYRKARFDFAMDQIDVIINILRELPFLKGKKQALIIHDPYSTAGSLVFENDVYEEIGFMVKTFATKEAALDWISCA